MSFFKISFIANLFKIKDVDGYENLQKRISEKKEFLENSLNYLKNLENSLKDISEKVQNSNRNMTNITFAPEEKNIHDTLILIGLNIHKELDSNFNLLGQIIKHLTTHKDMLIKELNLYEELKKTNKELQEEKEKLKKNKENFHKLGQKVENDIKKFVKNIPDLKDIYENEILNYEIQKIIETPKVAFEEYKISLNKTNQLIKTYNSKQLNLFNFFPDISSEEGVFYFRLIKIYLQSLEKQSEYFNLNISNIKNNKSLETNTKLMELIENSQNNKKEEKIQQFIHYQSDLDYHKCENDKEFELSSKSINIIKNFISNDLFPNYDYDIEVKNYKMSQTIKKLFKEKGDINPELANNFMNLINEPNVYKGFFVILSHLRATSKFLKSKELIDLLGKGFNIIAEYSVKNKLYENIKNCIILSQTYYYEDENKNKIYIFEHIKNNKYIKNSRFWRDFIKDMIKKEFIRFESVLPDSNINVEKNINITNKIKEKLNEVVFSQLLTYASNMKDFEFDKRVILKIIEEFVEKYNYISKNNLDNIYTIITQGKEDVEKLRKEYNTSLEDELIYEENTNIEDNTQKNFNKEKNEKEDEIKDNNEKENKIKDNNENEINIENQKKENNNDSEKKNENNIDEKNENNNDNEKKNENGKNENNNENINNEGKKE